jgi:hypothetical protein
MYALEGGLVLQQHTCQKEHYKLIHHSLCLGIAQIQQYVQHEGERIFVPSQAMMS